MEQATSSDVGKGKRRMIIIEETVRGKGGKHKRRAALGGHAFAVQFPPGHVKIEKEFAAQLTPLFHETNARTAIEATGYLSAMRHCGGINFTVGQPGGYRPRADTVVTIETPKLTIALDSGFIFFYNQFSGLVFGVGKQSDDGTWEGKIPLEYLTLSPQE